jgi:hypothetical protein
MPVSHTLESGILVITAQGSYAPEEVVGAFIQGLEDPRCPRPVGLLYDPSGSVDLKDRTPQQIRQVAMFLKPHAERIGRRIAVVVGNDVQFGLSRLGAVFAEDVGVEAQIFHSQADAKEWLSRGPRPSVR